MDTRKRLAAVAMGVSLVATLGMTACGDTGATDTATSAEAFVETTEAQPPTGVAEFSSDDEAWVGMTDYGVVYFVEDAASGQAAFMVYYTEDDTFIRYVGAEERDGDSVTITDNRNGKSIALQLSGPDSNGILTISFEGHEPATTSVMPVFDEIKGTFDQVDMYAKERE